MLTEEAREDLSNLLGLMLKVESRMNENASAYIQTGLIAEPLVIGMRMFKIGDKHGHTTQAYPK